MAFNFRLIFEHLLPIYIHNYNIYWTLEITPDVYVKMALQVVNNQTALGANRSIHQYPPPDLIQNIVPKDVNKQNSQYSTRYTIKSNINFLFPSVTTILCIFCVYQKILFSNVFILFKENISKQGSVGSFFTLYTHRWSQMEFLESSVAKPTETAYLQ